MAGVITFASLQKNALSAPEKFVRELPYRLRRSFSRENMIGKQVYSNGCRPLIWMAFCRATELNTDLVVMEFVKKETVLIYGPSVKMVSDNTTCLMSGILVYFIKSNGISWSKVLAYELV